MIDPFGGGRHRSAPLDVDDEPPTARFWVDPDPYTEDETPTARFVVNSYRGALDFADDDAPTARFVLNPYRDPGREAHDQFGDPEVRLGPPPVIEGEVVWRGDEPVMVPPGVRAGRHPGYVHLAPEPVVGWACAVPSPPATRDDDAGEPAAFEYECAEPADADEPVDADWPVAMDRPESVAGGEDDPEDAEPAEDADVPAEERWDDLSPHTVGGAVELIVQELAPTEMTRFPVVVQRFFADEILQRRVIRWALSGAKPDDPLALQLGGSKAELVTVLSLAMLTCAATGVLGRVGTRHHSGVVRWKRNRGAARRRLIHGPATALPHLSSLGTATVGQIVEEAAEDAGFTPDRARRLSILILSALTRPVH